MHTIINNSPICCGVLEKMDLQWMKTESGIKVMPFISGINMITYRVNHCPSCGVYVRDFGINPLNK